MREAKSYEFMCDKISIYGGICEGWFTDELRKEGFRYDKKKKEHSKYIEDIHTTFRVRLKRGFGYITFCPGKVLYGTNCYHLSYEEMHRAINLVKAYFNQFCFANHFEDFDNFKISRLDLALNLTFHKPLSEDKYYRLLDIFKRMSTHHCGELMIYKTSISRFNKSCKDLAYTKKEEIRAHKKSHSISAEECPQFIRREAALYSRILNKLLPRRERTIGNIDRLFASAVSKVNKILKVSLFQRIPSESDVMEQIEDGWVHSASVAEHKEFATKLNMPATDSKFPSKAYEDAVKTGTKERYNRFLREFQDKGINPYWCDELAGNSISTLKNSYYAYLKYKRPNNPWPPVRYVVPYIIIRVTKATKKFVPQGKSRSLAIKILGFT